jgi:hypothetical protein
LQIFIEPTVLFIDQKMYSILSIKNGNDNVRIEDNCLEEELATTPILSEMLRRYGDRFEEHGPPTPYSEHHFHTGTHAEVRDVIKQLKNNTKDIFGFSTSLVKTVQNCLISPITKLFNCAVKQGLFPDQLKKAAVAPIFKKGDAEDVNNHRPISVLPIFSKIFERLMLSQIKFLDNNKLLTPYQFGFRKNHSTTSAILHLTCNILNSFEQSEFYHTYFLELTKAFDCVSHELIKKLLLYNFHPTSTKFIFIFK